MNQALNNPLLETFNTPYHTAPFHLIQNEHYMPAFNAAMQEHLHEIEAITSHPHNPTFANTIVAFERSGRHLSRISSIFFNLLSAESNPQMEEIAQEVTPLLSNHSNNILLNKALFQRISTIHERRHTLDLSDEDLRLVEEIYKHFEDSGATLSEADKEKYRTLSQRLSTISLNFEQNLLKENQQYELHLTQEEDLKGLPDNIRRIAQQKARSKQKNGWIFDLSAPSYSAFMKYAQKRDLRKQLYLAFTSKGAKGDKLDNQENLKEIANIRLEIAQLLGYPDYASYALRATMAKDQNTVYHFLDELAEAFRTAAHADLAEITSFARQTEKDNFELQPWDWNFYAEKLKEKNFAISDQAIRPYFELENVKKAVFGLATQLYGISFKKNTCIPTYHPEVEAFEATDSDGTFLGILYTDFHPREGKRQGAWMTEFKGQYVDNQQNSRPHISLVMNFTPPTGDTPSLLTFDEVETFLHEFGHGLHGLLSNCTYESLCGTNVPRDFVELPSQIMENWLTQQEYLNQFAFHYQTGEKIPQAIIQNLINASNFTAGYLCYRQLAFAYLDMAWHTLKEPFCGNTKTFELQATQRVNLLPSVHQANISTSFAHIFAGGYAAGYYSYKWSEMLDADAFALFKEHGIFNSTIAKSFRTNILEKGNSQDPQLSYYNFRKKEPSIEALLLRSGIAKHP